MTPEQIRHKIKTLTASELLNTDFGLTEEQILLAREIRYMQSLAKNKLKHKPVQQVKYDDYWNKY